MPQVSAELAAQLAQEELNANMMGQSIYGEVGVPNEGDDLNEYLKRLYFAPGMSQRASDLAEMNGLDPAQFSQQQEQIAAETRHSSPAIFEAIGNVGNTFKDNPWLYLAPAAAAGLAGILGGGAGAATALPAEIEAIASAAGGAAAGGAAGGILPGLGAGIGAGVGGLSGGLGSLAGLLGTGALAGATQELAPGAGVLAPQPAPVAPFGADALASYGVMSPPTLAAGGGVLAPSLPQIPPLELAQPTLPPGGGVTAPPAVPTTPFGQNALADYGVTTTLQPGGGVLAPSIPAIGGGVLSPPSIPDPSLPPASVPGAQPLPPGGGVMAPPTQGGMGLQDWLTLGGALAGLAGANNDPQTTTTASGPPAYLQPYIEQGLQRTQDLYNQNPSAPVTPFSQQTQDALRLTEERARAGSPVTNAAQNYVTSGLNTPVTSQFGGASNPFSSSAYTSSGTNPYATSAYPGAGPNPYATSTYTPSGNNPYATSSYTSPDNPFGQAANPFGQANNPYLDLAFDRIANRTQNRLTSEFARSGRDVDASAPARAGMLADLAAQIYAPAYESERNRQLQYQQQLTGIGAQGFENAQSRNLQSLLQAQGIGAQGFESEAQRRAQAGLAAQGIGAQGYENEAQRRLQAGLTAQGIGAAGFENEAQRQQQAALAAQGIGAQGFENERSRMLSDLTAQRTNQTNMLGYAPQLAEQDYLNYAQLGNVGAQHEALAREQAGAPGLALDQYLARIQGFPGSSVTQTTPTNSNWLAGAAGGALLGNQIGQMWGAPYSGGYGSGGYGWGYRP